MPWVNNKLENQLTFKGKGGGVTKGTVYERIDKLQFITIKNFCSVKRIKRQATEWKNRFAVGI